VRSSVSGDGDSLKSPANHLLFRDIFVTGSEPERMPGPIVEATDRVALRTLESEDIEFLQQAYTNPAVRYPLGAPIKTRPQLREWIDDDETDRFIITEQPTEDEATADVEPTPIGVVTVADASWRRPELTYWISPHRQNEGLGTAAVALTISHVFRAQSVPAVGAVAYDFNDASKRLLESLGFSIEGRVRKERFVDSAYRDTIVYGLLREEWVDHDRPEY